MGMAARKTFIAYWISRRYDLPRASTFDRNGRAKATDVRSLTPSLGLGPERQDLEANPFC